jgi:hypothetical protein
MLDLKAASERPWFCQKSSEVSGVWHIDQKRYAALNAGLIAAVWATGPGDGNEAAANARLIVAGVALLDDAIALAQSSASDAEIGRELRVMIDKELAR